MGVFGPFWSQLKSVDQPMAASELSGKRVAIDMSKWLMEAHEQKALEHHANASLFVVFTRTTMLLKLGCRPIAVLEGAAHPAKKRGRNQLDKWADRISPLLEALGVPVVRATGEAEATAAALNKHGLVDGVITADSDAFLYGATTVYRGVTVESIKRGLATRCEIGGHEVFGSGSPQRNAVACALLAGTDIHPDSPQGVGVKKALTFVKHCVLKNKDPLDLLEKWRDDKPDGLRLGIFSNAAPETMNVATAVFRQTDFPDPRLVDQFLGDHLPLLEDIVWRMPSARALFFVNAAACIKGTDVRESNAFVQRALDAPFAKDDDDEAVHPPLKVHRVDEPIIDKPAANDDKPVRPTKAAVDFLNHLNNDTLELFPRTVKAKKPAVMKRPTSLPTIAGIPHNIFVPQTKSRRGAFAG